MERLYTYILLYIHITYVLYTIYNIYYIYNLSKYCILSWLQWVGPGGLISDLHRSKQMLEKELREQSLPVSSAEAFSRAALWHTLMSSWLIRIKMTSKHRYGTWAIISAALGTAFHRVIGRFLLLVRSLLIDCHVSVFYYSCQGNRLY